MPPGTVCLPGSVTELDLTRAKVKTSNLGGAGPDSGDDEVLLFKRVGTFGGVYFDLEVSATSVYQPYNASSNGIVGGLGQISLMAGTSVELEFAFKSSKSGESLTLRVQT